MVLLLGLPGSASAGWQRDPVASLGYGSDIASTGTTLWQAHTTATTWWGGGDLYVRSKAAGTWTTIGAKLNGANPVPGDPSIALLGAVPYVAYVEAQPAGGSNTTCVLRVKRWTGAAWTQLGADITTFTGTTWCEATRPQIGISGVDIAVAWENAGSAVHAFRWNGAAWNQLGGALPISDLCCSGPESVTFYAGEPVVTFGAGNGSRTNVDRWNGATWDVISSSGAAFYGQASNTGGVLRHAYPNWMCSPNTEASLYFDEYDGASWSTLAVHKASNGCRNFQLADDGVESALAYSVAPWGGVSVWTSSGGLLNGTIGRMTTPTGLAWLDGVPHVTARQAGVNRVWTWSAGTGTQPLVPNADRPGTTEISFRRPDCTTPATTDLWTRVDDTVDNGDTTDCDYNFRSDNYLTTGINSIANFVSFELSDPNPCIVSTVTQTRVRAWAWKTGGKTAQMTVSLRRANGTLVGAPTTWPISTTAGEYEYLLTGLSLTSAETAGLYIDVATPITGGGSSTTAYISELQVDITHDEPLTPCAAPYTPVLGSPADGVTITTQLPTFSAQHIDPNGDTGTLYFEVCSKVTAILDSCTKALGTILTSGNSASGIINYGSGSWTTATPLPLGTYYWHAYAVDATGARSPWSATNSFTIAAAPNITGNALENESGTIWSGCDGSTPNIAVAIDGIPAGSTSCSAATGGFTLAPGYMGSNRVVTAYLNDNAAGNDGVVYTRNLNTTTAITGLRLVEGVAGIRSESATNYTNTAISTFDNTHDADIPIDVTGTALTATGTLGQVRIDTGETYAPGGDVTIPRLRIQGTYTGSTGALQLTAGGMSACDSTTARPLCIDGGVHTAGTGTTRYMATSDATIETSTYAALVLSPSGAGSPTFHLGSVPSGTITISSMTLGDGTNPVTVSTSAASANVNATGSFLINAGATLAGAGTGTLTTTGSVSGAGTVALTGGTLELRSAGANPTFGSTAGAGAWTLPNLTFSNSSAGARTFSTAAVGTGTIIVSGSLTVGRAGDAATSTFNANTNDRTLDINTDMTVLSTGIFAQSSAAPMTIAGNVTVAGTWQANAGTVRLDDAALTTTITQSAALSFASLIVNTPSKTVLLDAVDQLNVTGTLTVTGGACNTPVILRSVTAANQADINATGAATIGYSRLKDVRAVAALTATNTIDDGNNTNITINQGTCTASSLTITADAATRALGGVLPGTDVTATTRVEVITDATTGYALSAVDESDTWGVSSPAPGTIADWTGTGAAPSVWPAGTSGGFGISVIGATGGRLAKWGSVGGPYGAGDFVNNAWAGLDLATPAVLHTRASATASDLIDIAYRVNAPTTQVPGAYQGQVTYTAVINP